MEKSGSFLHDRSLWVYYALFFSGTIVLIYQALGLSIVGDSVNFLCLLFILNGLHVRRWINIVENALILTMGYILPLLIRNSLKLSYAEAPSILDFAKLALLSAATTLAFGLLFTLAGFLIRHFARKIWQLRRGRITTSNITED